MTFSGKDITIENCSTNYNNYRNFKIDWHSGGIKNVKMENSVIENHTAIGNNGPGIWFDISCNNINISDCNVQANNGTGIFYEISDSAIVKNNIVYNNTSTGIYISASNGCGVYNNLVYGNERGIVVAGVPRESFTLENNAVENNIVVNSNDAEIVIEQDGEVSNNNHSDYNLFYSDNDRLRFKKGYGTVVSNIERWQSITKDDQHSIVADPKIEITKGNNFVIQANSPVYGRGKIIPAVTKDMNGKKRSSQKFDIGPFSK